MIIIFLMYSNRHKAVKISQGLVQRMLGFATIKLDVIGYTTNSGDDDKNADLGVFVPFCKYDEIGAILDKVLPDYVPIEKQTRSVSFFPFISWFLLIFGAIVGITLTGTVAVMAVLNAPSWTISAVALVIAGLALIVIIIKLISAALSYQNSGIAVESRKLTAYSGGFTRYITVFNARNLIAVENVTTPLRKKHGIASLVMHIKTNALSNEIKVHIQNDELSTDTEQLLTL